MLVLAVAVSLDSLAMGITYGINRITIPWGSKIILSLVSGCSVFISMVLGWLLEQQINSRLATTLGGLIFILLGLYNLWHSYRPTYSRVLINWRIPVLGLVIQVCQEPLKADSDHSKTISGGEAVVLGGALALDAVGAGFGAAMLGLPILPTAFAVILASLVFIIQGLKAGIALASSPRQRLGVRWLPGVIVLSMGLLKIIRK